jgi:CPA2 family monovalent cation:H+ antiporter-2
MDPLALTLIELGAVVFCLGLLARVAERIGMSPIPLYLVGGLFFGAGGFMEFKGIQEFAHVSGEIGVILLLLMLGLEYTAAELVTGMRRSWQAGVLDFVLNFLPGAGLAVFLGWGLVGAMVMGGVTYISSSGIAAKVITDLGRIGNRETPVILSILVFEDLAMALYLPILTAILSGVSFVGGMQTVGISLAVVTLVLMVALRHGHHVSKAVHSENSEVFLLNLLGAALLVAGVASALQVSAAVGAFLLGIAISGATASSATRILEPLRDLFAAIFFVAFGLNTDPSSIPPVIGWALALALVTAATKMVTGIWAAKRVGIAVPGRFRAGAALIARGEFSIVIAGLAVASGAATGELAALATAYVLIMAIMGPLAARYVEPVVKMLRRPAKPQPAGIA